MPHYPIDRVGACLGARKLIGSLHSLGWAAPLHSGRSMPRGRDGASSLFHWKWPPSPASGMWETGEWQDGPPKSMSLGPPDGLNLVLLVDNHRGLGWVELSSLALCSFAVKRENLGEQLSSWDEVSSFTGHWEFLTLGLPTWWPCLLLCLLQRYPHFKILFPCAHYDLSSQEQYLEQTWQPLLLKGYNVCFLIFSFFFYKLTS